MKLHSISKGHLSRARDDRGQAALELLLIFPTFIFIVLLAVDFGVWMYESVSVANAVREGARYAALDCPTDGGCDVDLIKQKTADKSSGSLDPGDVHVDWPDSGAKGTSVVVSACRSYTLLFLPITFSTGLASTADMRIEKATTDASGGSTC